MIVHALRLVVFALLVSLVGCGGGGDSKPLRISVYGDSLMFGYELQTGFMARMKELRPSWEFEERYAGSLRLQQLIDGYQEPFDNAPAWTFPAGPQKPFVQETRTGKIVVLQAGVNDTFHDASKCEQHMRLAIETVLKEGRTPVLTGIVGIQLETFPPHVAPQWKACNASFRALAQEYRLQHAGWDTDYQGPQDILPDRVHRTQEASDRMAVLLVKAIERTMQ